MGKHRNRARICYSNGQFRAEVPVSEAQRLVDFGYADRISQEGEKPLRVQLRASKPRLQPIPNTPTSGCTAPSTITARESVINAGVGAPLRSFVVEQPFREGIYVRDENSGSGNNVFKNRIVRPQPSSNAAPVIRENATRTRVLNNQDLAAILVADQPVGSCKRRYPSA